MWTVGGGPSKNRKKKPKFKIVDNKVVKIYSEREIQIDCFKWIRLAYPWLIAFAVPNGGKRNLLEAVDLKRQGVLAGIPDIFIAFPCKGYHGIFIELKTTKNALSPEQALMIEKLTHQGYYCSVCRSQKDFEETVNWYVRDSTEAA